MYSVGIQANPRRCKIIVYRRRGPAYAGKKDKDRHRPIFYIFKYGVLTLNPPLMSFSFITYPPRPLLGPCFTGLNWQSFLPPFSIKWREIDLIIPFTWDEPSLCLPSLGSGLVSLLLLLRHLNPDFATNPRTKYLGHTGALRCVFEKSCLFDLENAKVDRFLRNHDFSAICAPPYRDINAHRQFYFWWLAWWLCRFSPPPSHASKILCGLSSVVLCWHRISLLPTST